MTTSAALRAAAGAVTPELLAKYDRPGPRYTSYPTAPEWQPFTPEQYARQLELAGGEPAAPFSLYVHLPFCESLCLYCGCTVVITKNRAQVGAYLDRLEKEIDRVAELLPARRAANQLHLGGGTPTYLDADELERLHRMLARRFTLAPGSEVALEVDPRVTTTAQLERLAGLGFNRVSMGVQDFAEKVQRAVNRVQSEAETRALVEAARGLGYRSVNLDLMYGLPEQNAADFARTLAAVVALRPDRIALFSYAHVPWLKPAQGSFARHGHDLPDAAAKFGLFRLAFERLLDAGYRQVGMDHFALEGDELNRARERGDLYRNFQGYTVHPAPDTLAFGMSAIGDVAGAYVQNARELGEWGQRVDRGELPTVKGFVLSDEDKLRRRVIHGLLCNFALDLGAIEREFGVDFAAHFAPEIAALAGFVADGLVALDERRIEVTPLGRFFIRNLCMVFDPYLAKRSSDAPLFSRTV